MDWEATSTDTLAANFNFEHDALSVHKADTERAIRQKYSLLLRQAPPTYVLEFAERLLIGYGHRWQAYEIIAVHKGTFRSLDGHKIEQLGQGIDSWWTTDSFARTLSGPAWMADLVSNELIAAWAGSTDFWWRRAALVSTVAFNVRSQGGKGDVPRTLAICRMLAADHEDMVVKGLSWALRQLVYFDPQAVERFLREYDSLLASRVKREVGTKLRIGLKNQRRKLSTKE